MKIKFFAMEVCGLLMSASVFAQKDSKVFISLQGGADFSINENGAAYFREHRGGELFSGLAALSAGYYFNPRIGSRLQLEYSHNKSAANYEQWNYVFNPYDFHAMSVYADFIINGGNVAVPKAFNWRFFAGLGYAHSFAFSSEGFAQGTKRYPLSQNNDCFSFRFGFILEYIFRCGVGLFFEGNHEWITDKYNGVAGTDIDGNKNGFPFDMKLNNQIGVSYHF